MSEDAAKYAVDKDGRIAQYPTDALLARACDVIRRSGVEDAERLCEQLSRELASPRFRLGTGRQEYVFTSQVILPAGEYPADSRVGRFFTPANAVTWVTEGLFPWTFSAAEVHMGGLLEAASPDDRDPLAEALHVREYDFGNEVGRYPVTAFSRNRHAVQWNREYQVGRPYALDLWTAPGFVLAETRALTLTLAGRIAPP